MTAFSTDGLGDQSRLTLRMAQTPVQHCLPQLMERIVRRDIDPAYLITVLNSAE